MLTRVLHFDASEPLYYVAVYMQLILVTPLLIGLLDWCSKKRKIVRLTAVWFGILFFCYVSVHRTNLFDIPFGGGNFLAGVWLMFWFGGMCIRYYESNIIKKKRNSVLAIHTSVLILYQVIFVNKGLNLLFHPILNGNQVGMTWANAFESVLLFFGFCDSVKVYEESTGELGRKLLLPLNYVGSHTLYIFMYHLFFLSIYQSYFGIKGLINKFFCLLFIFIGPIVLENCTKTILKW